MAWTAIVASMVKPRAVVILAREHTETEIAVVVGPGITGIMAISTATIMDTLDSPIPLRHRRLERQALRRQLRCPRPRGIRLRPRHQHPLLRYKAAWVIR